MLVLHHKALLFVAQSFLEHLQQCFLIVCGVIVGLSLPGATIAFIANSFVFGITFGLSLNIAAATLGVTALYQVV